MIRCCAFGTVRFDIHVYKEYGHLNDYEEIKVNEMALHIGGSVYNTVAVLNELKQDVVFYTLNATDDIADFIKLRMINKSVTFITSKHDKNATAKSIIFVDNDGKKKMISYDGIRSDSYVLSKLKKDIINYDLFYTSFYEVNNKNLEALTEVMRNSKCCFVDLSPLIYEVESDTVNRVLNHVHILSGTKDEYDLLLNILQLESVENLISKYNLKYLFVKNGSEGAILYYDRGVIECKPNERKTSHNTTGCGDTFNAGVIYSFSKGTNETDMLRTAVNFATLVAYEGFNLDLFSKFESE